MRTCERTYPPLYFGYSPVCYFPGFQSVPANENLLSQRSFLSTGRLCRPEKRNRNTRPCRDKYRLRPALRHTENAQKQRTARDMPIHSAANRRGRGESPFQNFYIRMSEILPPQIVLQRMEAHR